MQAPANFNFIDHYQNDGLRKFTMTFKYSSGKVMDLKGCLVRLQLVNSAGLVAWEFSTLRDKDGLLTIGENGVITFESINSWSILPGTYVYDLEVTFPDGFVCTYLKGSWKINKDITK